MIKRKYMRTRQLKPGMKLDHPVVDRLGRNLVARGAELDDYMIDSLLKLGIMSVYIQEGEEEENPEQVPASPKAEKNIDRRQPRQRTHVEPLRDGLQGPRGLLRPGVPARRFGRHPL